MSIITIDGKSFVGNNLSIINGVVSVNGIVQNGKVSGIVKIVIEGNIDNLKTDATVEVHGNVQNIDAGGSVQCGSVGGNIDAGGSVITKRR